MIRILLTLSLISLIGCTLSNQFEGKFVINKITAEQGFAVSCAYDICLIRMMSGDSKRWFKSEMDIDWTEE